MKRILLSILLSICLMCALILGASAASEFSLVEDNSGLFTAAERTALEQKASELSRTYQMDVVIITIDAPDGATAQVLADDLYDSRDYGYGADYSGLLFLLDMNHREWYISTSGKAITAFSDYGLDRLGELVVPYLSSGDYYTAFDVYLDALPDYFDAYEAGRPIDIYYEEERKPLVILFLGSLLVGAAAAGIAIVIMRGSMNSKRKQRSAESYLEPGSFNLHTHRDMYLYSRTTKVRRQENSSSGSSHSRGGSSVHRSSSGRSHGGRGGKF
ncbi:MAG: TPM domain-containing protein [Oscillospiraceae bacterium]|nr:TPM domain-containing protein [Oscillospiraceae bacterium]